MSNYVMGDSLTLFVDQIIDKDGVIENLAKPQAIGYATSHSFSLKSNPEEVTHKGTGGWSVFEYGRKSWELSTEAFEVETSAYLNGVDIERLLISGSKVRVLIGKHNEDYVMEETATTFYEGLALIDSIEKSPNAGERLKYSITFAPASGLTEKTAWTATV